MPSPVLSLPVVQRWDCSGCGECCRSYSIRVTEVERARIEAQGWQSRPGYDGLPGVVAEGKPGEYRLNHRADGACVFLAADNRCRIHAEFGAAAKPMACRIYPFVLVPAGDHWRVGLRLACPAAVADQGRPLAAHEAELRVYAGLLEADAGVSLAGGVSPLPPLQAGESVPWADLIRFARFLADRVADESVPLDARLRQVLAVAALCRQSRFDTISGARLGEFLEVISAAVAEDVPRDAADVPPPSWLGRTVFRQVLAVYSRKDAGTYAGISARGRWTRLRAAWRFAVGCGPVPKLHGRMPATTFEAAEAPQPLTAEGDALLTRFYRLKLESLQFCGPTNFGRPFWAGLDSLVLTYPTIRWLNRVFAAGGHLSPDDALRVAVQAVDDNFGFNPQLGTRRMAWGTQTLAERGELAKLVAWYGR